jgi:hypothetical protein
MLQQQQHHQRAKSMGIDNLVKNIISSKHARKSLATPRKQPNTQLDEGEDPLASVDKTNEDLEKL